METEWSITTTNDLNVKRSLQALVYEHVVPSRRNFLGRWWTRDMADGNLSFEEGL